MAYSFSNILNEITLGLLGRPEAADQLSEEMGKKAKAMMDMRIPTQQALQSGLQQSMGYLQPSMNYAEDMVGANTPPTGDPRYDVSSRYKFPSIQQGAFSPVLDQLLKEQEAKRKETWVPYAPPRVTR